jgi:CRP/FNR family transcriptional regulator, cyclic AMP receptor protein
VSVDPIHLADIPFFAELDDEQRALLAARLDTIHEPVGKSMWVYGDPGDAAYIVRKGAVEIYSKNDTGERLVLETARVGDFFGEISLLDGGPRTASVVVIEDLEAILVDHGDLEEFLRVCPGAAIKLLASSGQRIRETAKLLRHSVSRDINEEVEDKRTRVLKIADWISEFSGSLEFLFIHLGLFFLWIVLNVGPLARTGIGNFDPFPFGLLTMVVSLEAIILSVFVLLSQNRQVARDRVRNDIEYQVNLKAELEIGHLHEKVDHFHQEVMRRLSVLEKASLPPPRV